MIVDILKLSIQTALENLKLPFDDIRLEHPNEENRGDYSSNVAMIMFSKIKNAKQSSLLNKIQTPRELAEIIVKQLKKDKNLSKIVSKIEIAGTGFINFWVNEEYLQTTMFLNAKEQFDIPSYHWGKNKKLMVEFAHPNTHKPFHIGHLRNIVTGESLVRILESLGNEVKRGNYEGDVGMHIAKCLYGIKYEKRDINTITDLHERIDFLGASYVNGNNAYEDDQEAHREIDVINKKIYEQDSEIYTLWKQTRAWSLEYFEKVYSRVYTHFDRLFFESEVYARGLEIAKSCVEKGILEKSQGAIVFKGEPYNLHTRVFVTRDGNPTYEGKELGLAELETTLFGTLDKIIHVVDIQQSGYFSVLFKVLELIDTTRYKNVEEHFAYGFVTLKSGKMSSRTGNIILGEWLLDEVKKRIQKQFQVDESKAEIIAVCAVKYSLLKVEPKSKIVFDIDQSISLEGNSGPYLLYTYARARSVLRKSTIKNQNIKMQNKNHDVTRTQEELAIIRMLYKYPEVVLEAGKSYSPNLICNYLYDLAQRFNLFYQKVPILRAEDQSLDFKLKLTEATSRIIKNGLDLLGIKTLESM